MVFSVFDCTDNNIDELTQNYQEMDEAGKEKLSEVLEKIREIENSVNMEVKNE